MHTQYPIKNHQHGAVLVISLLVLLVLTLLGVSSLDNSVMEEKMAANSQTAMTTFQKAETAIKQTYYTQSLNTAQAVFNAQAGATVVYPVDGSISSSSQMNYPLELNPTSSGTGTDSGRGRSSSGNSSTSVAYHNIEIIGIANVANIRSRNIQGYKVGPMMAAP